MPHGIGRGSDDDFPPPFERKSVLALDLDVGSFALQAYHDSVTDGYCGIEVEGHPAIVSYQAYFTLDAPARVELVCGGGRLFTTTNREGFYWRSLDVTNARIEARRVTLHDTLLPDLYE
jgi:hypothetical protein